MRYFTLTLFFTVFFLGLNKTGSAQADVAVHPSLIGKGVFLGISPPLRDLPALTAEQIAAMKQAAMKKAARKEENEPRLYPFAKTAFPKGPDEAWQQMMGKSPASAAPIQNFEGQTTGSYPPDCNGTAGPNHYMQVVNVTYSIYNKTGTLLAGPTALNTLFTGVPGATYNDGDPTILYDKQADRWIVGEFTFGHTNDYMLVAVSTTNDPTGTWYKYSFDIVEQPDYPKLGVWQDGYYLGINNGSGNDTYVFERSKMLLGQTAQMVAFDNPWRPAATTGSFLCVPPLDCDGPAAPAGSPGMFIAFNDDAVSGGTDQLWLYELAVNWTTPASSTFTRPYQLNVTAFDSQFTSTWDDITQPTSQKLDAVPQVIMNAPQYRNFGTYQTIVCCHTVDVDATNHGGIRWYELRKTPPATTWVVRQQGTYAPDANSRWMGSIRLNGSGKIALGYSVSGSSVYPGIRYCGQSASAYAAGSGVMDIAEQTILAGTVAQSGYNRWGDYSGISVDPADDQTFWYTTEYVKTGGTTKGSRIASFKFGNDPTVTTLAATSVTGTTATINGSVNPNGLATTYYFQWGTTVSYGNTTTSTSAGSGTTALAVSANLTGLTAGTTYHFRLSATNSDGTVYGSDLSFTPGAASVTTTAASSLTMNSAASGGNVITDGGSAVTARGVCWATTATPTISGSHTTDGSGTGVFTSSITGLSASTLYHVRAYATNAGGTYYGDDLTFTTLCGIVTTFPWNEGFENGGLIPNCWSQEQVASSGINWTFIAGSGNSHPAAAHGGSYNATLIDVTSADNKTKLITPTLNLTSVSTPQLKFWHTQAYWTPDQDQLTVFYKTSAAGTWTQLAAYTASITAWTQETITLPSPTADYYIAFEGNAKYGYGVCLDDVQVASSCTSTVPVSISIAASANPVCQGTSVTFTATPTNGGTTPAYQWKVNGTSVSAATAVTYTYIPVNNDAVTCVLTSNATCITGNPATSNSLTMVVNVPLSVGSVSANQSICANATPVQLTGIPPSNGTLPTYQWQSSLNNTTFSNISGATLVNYQPGLLTATTYYKQLQNATGTCGGPLPTNTVTITVNPLLPVNVSIGSSANPVCAGTQVTFTATPVNGGTPPVYQWKVNGVSAGTNNALFSYIPASGDQVSCTLTSNATCATGSPATSNVLTMTVNPLLPVSVSISPSANQVCAGTSVTFTPAPINGGTPAYQWFKNTVAVGTGATYSYVPVNGDQVYVIMTSSLTCKSGSPATSNTVTMTVNPNLPVSVSVGASANPVCAGTIVMFTATPVNGGNPSYQWFKNNIAVGTGASYSCVPADGDQVYVTLTSDVPCKSGNPATSNTVTMTVNPNLPVSVSVGASANPVCAGTSVLFSATPVNGGNPSYQWFKNNIAVGTGASYSCVPANGDQVYVTLTSDLPCKSGSPATSNMVTMTVNPNLPVSVSAGASANPVCASSVVTFTAVPVNGGTTPAYQWQVNGSNAGTNGSSFTYAPANNDQVSCVLTSSETCTAGNPASSNIVSMTVNPLLPVSVSIVASANPVDKKIPVTFTATPVNGGASPAYQWMVNGINAGTNSNAYTYLPVDGDAVSCILTSGETCTSTNPANSNIIIMVVNPVSQFETVQDVTVSGTACYDAIQTITVAGNATNFIVITGGSATMIAGHNILYYPGTFVEPGGYMHGYIADGGPWCVAPSIVTAAAGTGAALVLEQSFYKVYPNPTSGAFTLELNAIDAVGKCQVEIYDMNGLRMLTAEISGERKHEFSLSDKPAGIYLIRVITGQNSGTTRILKQM